MKIIDNFCDQEVFNDIRNIILNHNFPFYLNDFVAAPGEEEPWCWYGIHRLYDDNVPLGEFPHLIPMLTEQIRIFAPEYRIRGLIRIKINFYPHTETLKEHPPHVDLDYKN